MRLINSTDFTAEIEFADADVCAEYADESCEWGFSRDKIKEIIGKIPSIDAEPVIRCRECVNCLIDNTERKYHLCMRHSSVFPRKVDLMDFCSYGERKEGADNG